jgi:hypothetical protein
LSGGARPFPEPGEGDIDLFVYCTEVPARHEQRELLMSLPRGDRAASGVVRCGKSCGCVMIPMEFCLHWI